MTQEKRISKRQMKEDKLVSTTFKFTEYVQKNQTPFIIGVAAVVVIFAVVLLMRSGAERNRNDAAALLSRAEMESAMGQYDQTIADLQTIVNDYGGTPSARTACFTLANAFFGNRQYDDAEKYFRKILSDYSGDEMTDASAAAGVGACLEEKKDFINAAKMYQKAAEYYPRDLWSPGYLLKAGRDFAQGGDKTSAENVLQELENKYPNATETNTARRTLAELRY